MIVNLDMWKMSILKPKISWKHSEKFPKNEKKNNLLKNKRTLNTEIQAKWGPIL